MTPIRVLIVDDHPLFRDGLRSTLDRCEQIVVVGELASGDDVSDKLGPLRVDVVVMDLDMPGIGGVEAIRRITESHPTVAAVALTMHDDEPAILAALSVGARGYLTKDADRDDIVRAIESAACGSSMFAEPVRRVLTDKAFAERSPQARLFPQLTDRELEVLTHLADGLTNSQIADRLRLRSKTVRNYASNIFLKLGVSDRGHAIVIARDAGLGRCPNLSKDTSPRP